MKRLIIPSDFSPASKYAFEYAEWLSLQLKTELVAVNVQPHLKAEETVAEETLAALQARNDELLRQRLIKFTTPYPNHVPETLATLDRVKCRIRRGRIVDQIIQGATEENADLIVIGTRSKHHLLEHLWGSVTTDLLAQCPLPVLVVPQGTEFQKIQTIAFATDISLQEPSSSSFLQQMAAALNATINPFYVDARVTERQKLQEETLEVNRENGRSKVTMVRATSVVKGIDFFLEKHPAEILALYMPHRAFPDKLIHSSLSKRLAYRTPIPMLVVK